jgi:hypothetical protein
VGDGGAERGERVGTFRKWVEVLAFPPLLRKDGAPMFVLDMAAQKANAGPPTSLRSG